MGVVIFLRLIYLFRLPENKCASQGPDTQKAGADLLRRVVGLLDVPRVWDMGWVVHVAIALVEESAFRTSVVLHVQQARGPTIERNPDLPNLLPGKPLRQGVTSLLGFHGHCAE